MPIDALSPGEKPAEPKESGIRALCNEVYDFGKSAAHGFGHEVVKPFVGAEQIVTGQTGEQINPKTPEQERVGYKIGSFAGQAADFLAVQVVCKKIGLSPKTATILTSGALAALNPTEAGGHTLDSVIERGQNFMVGAGSMAAFEGANGFLAKKGLAKSFSKNIMREASSGAFAGIVSAQSNSFIKTGHAADLTTTAESMAGWAATGTAFHVVGVGAGRLKAELVPELLVRTGNLKPTVVEGGTTREFFVTSGKENMNTFTNTYERGTTVTVREVLTATDGKVNLGERKNMLVQHLSANEGEGRLLPQSKQADLIATCHPENLAEATKAKHVFGEKEGNVWLFTGKNNRLLLSSGDVPVNVTNVNGYKGPYKLNHGETTIHVMAPLLVGNPDDMNSPESLAAREEWRRQLAEAKKLKIDGVSMDMWWGMIEKEKGKYNFDYFHGLTDDVIAAGLDVATILSFHQCGGNVGDTANIKLPEWVWKDLADKLGSTDLNIGKYKSEQGNYSPEYIQLWADKVAVNYYAGVMSAFKDSFAAKAPFISEINVSLGPAGEMRYPSYNSHDVGTGYPTRGALQAYSDLAKEDFRAWALKRYGSVQAVGNAWNIKDLNVNDIQPPSDAQGFYDRNDHQNSQYGRDLIDWYNESLVNHGKVILQKAASIFGAKDSPFLGTAVGAKIPGVHWRMGWRNNDTIFLSDRKAETNAGLITTSKPWTEENDYGYSNILNMLKEIQPLRPGQGTPIIPSYTCLELPDGQDGPDAQSLPHTAATRFGQGAMKRGLTLKGENALSGTLYNGYDWDLMDGEVKTPFHPERGYSGLTLLRLQDVVDNPLGRQKISELIEAIHTNLYAAGQANLQPGVVPAAAPEQDKAKAGAR